MPLSVPHPFLSAILLAAGRSSRMGAFKPLLPFGPWTVIESCISNLLAGGVEDVVVVLGHRADELRGRLANLPVRFAFNKDPESEMGASVACGVREVSPRADAVFIALVDQPAVPPEVVRFLAGERARTGARLIVPEYEGRGGHPVLVDLCFREELLRLGAGRALRDLLGEHREEVLRAPVASPYVARDMDRWDDYRALHLEVFGTEPPWSGGRA